MNLEDLLDDEKTNMICALIKQAVKEYDNVFCEKIFGIEFNKLTTQQKAPIVCVKIMGILSDGNAILATKEDI